MTNNARQWVRLTEPSINQGSSMPRSYSVWIAMTGITNHSRGLAIGSPSNSCELASPNNFGSTLELAAGGWGNDTRSGTYITLGSWHHYVQQYYADGTLDLYLDGIRIAHLMNKNFNINSTVLALGWLTQDVSNSSYLIGYVSTARLWNRTLTDPEIAELAAERIPHYTITASDLSFSLYQKNESYSISYSSPMTSVTFEIIEGTLPNTISFNTSTGQFTGKGLTDADHVYNLKVRLTAPNSDSAICNVTIHTYKTARISLSNQSFSFISNKAESKSMTYTSDEAVTFTIESGTLPTGMTQSGASFISNGQNTSAENKQVVIRATSANNQAGVTAMMTLNMQMNAIVCNAQTMKFYTGSGVSNKAIKYSGSLNTVSDAIFLMTGILPTGVTFDTATGTFTSDGTQTADETASVSVTVSSANGTSTAATATITLEVHEGAPAIPDDYVFYAPLNDVSATVDETGNYQLTFNASNATHYGVPCISTSNANGMEVNAKPQDFTSDTNKGTWSFWLNKQANGHLKGIMGGNYQFRVCLVNSDGVLEFTLNDYESKIGRFSFPLSVNVWYNIVFTYDGAECKSYLNGDLANTVSFSSVPTDSGNLRLGVGYFGSISRYYSAFRIYDRVLTTEEIQTLAAEFTPQV